MHVIHVRSIAAVTKRLEELRGRRGGALVVAIDGYSGSGKSTLAAALALKCQGVIVPVDDFYAGGSAAEWDSRSPAQNAALGIDWKRLRSAVVPLRGGKPVEWRPFDWHTGKGLDRQVISRDPAELVVLEGAYSSSAELADLVDISVFLDVLAEVRFARIVKRDGGIGSWGRRWNAAEQYYFLHARPRSMFDIVLSNPEVATGELHGR